MATYFYNLEDQKMCKSILLHKTLLALLYNMTANICGVLVAEVVQRLYFYFIVIV